MRIEASASLANVTPTVTIHHGDGQISFSVAMDRRNLFPSDYDVFSHINAYWADQTQDVQQRIYDIYEQIFHAFDSFYNMQDLKTYLQDKIEELMRYHQLDYVQEWIAFRAHDISIPEKGIPDEYKEDVDRNFSREKTYTKSDYKRLVALALVCRALVPIWGEYLYIIKQTTDKIFRELQAFQLTDRVFTQDIPAINKLMTYIEATIRSSNFTDPSNILKGISTSDYPRWFLALVCIRCLTVGDIRGLNPEAHLVTYINMFISKRLDGKREMSDNRIKNKEIDESTGEDGARASALERYKVKANISVGEIVELEYFLSDIHRVANYLCPGIDIEEVYRGIEHAREYQGRIARPQIRLLRWLIKPIAPDSSILYLSEIHIKQLLGIAEAVLWKRGHHYLSVLSTCYPITSDKEMVVSPIDSKKRIADELLVELDKLYPYKKNVRNKKTGMKEVNYATESIDSLTNDFMVFGWKPTADIERVEFVLGYKTKRFPIKPDIKTDLARLVIEIQTRSYLNPR